MTTLQAIWLGVGLALVAFLLIAWLKGAFGLVGAVSRKFSHEVGQPWTRGAFAEPLGAFVTVVFFAALGPAHPESWWARSFYGSARMAKARERYPEDATARPTVRTESAT